MDAPALLERNDAVALTRDDQQWHVDVANPFERVVGISDQRPDRQPPVVILADIGHRRERRSQDESLRWMRGGEFDGNGSTKRFTEIDQSSRIDIVATDQILTRGARVTRQPLLGRRSRVSTETSIIEEKDL